MKEEEQLEKKIQIVNNILDDVREIFILIHPMIEKVLSLEEAKKPKFVSNLNKSAKLFKDIAELCRELEDPQHTNPLTQNLKKVSYFI
ncbi:MAG: hypothetical protein GF317_20445 [Candidatus Lokiarchaeota archaeon]|nr:hypothetical protein [Candidatus Lokiarchaeota archaeon]MBD3201856.1 hypothetical protein [Candidatus Lokiarchaeota archaeon]